RARDGITALTGLPPLTPDSTEWYGQMAAFPLPRCDGETLKGRLYDEYRVEAPVTTLGDRQFLRISVQGYNRASDIAALLAALRAVLTR
ncbi:MAG TPA: aminotransferase, partial [Anaerolineae bacterium]